MAIFGIFDLLIGGGPIVGLAAVVVAWLRGTVGVSAVWALGGVLALLVVFNVAYFNGFGTDPVIGTPTRAQVTGTWVGDHDAMLVLRPDGTFTASGLPAYVGAVMAFPGQKSGLPQNPPSGHGTWTIGPGDFNGPPESVIFTFACAPGPGRCATFDLQAETSSPAGDGGPALFYYLGDPDDWSNQYAFVQRGRRPARPARRGDARPVEAPA